MYQSSPPTLHHLSTPSCFLHKHQPSFYARKSSFQHIKQPKSFNESSLSFSFGSSIFWNCGDNAHTRLFAIQHKNMQHLLKRGGPVCYYVFFLFLCVVAHSIKGARCIAAGCCFCLFSSVVLCFWAVFSDVFMFMSCIESLNVCVK